MEEAGEFCNVLPGIGSEPFASWLQSGTGHFYRRKGLSAEWLKELQISRPRLPQLWILQLWVAVV